MGSWLLVNCCELIHFAQKAPFFPRYKIIAFLLRTGKRRTEGALPGGNDYRLALRRRRLFTKKRMDFT
jgi:hypothetical protein